MDIKKLEEGVRQLTQFISFEQSAVIANVDSTLETTNSDGNQQPAGTVAMQRATSFLLEVQKQASECATLINDTTEDFHTLLRYLGFVDNKEETDAKDSGSGRDTSLSPESVFGQILSFAKSIHSASSYAQTKEKRRLKLLSSS